MTTPDTNTDPFPTIDEAYERLSPPHRALFKFMMAIQLLEHPSFASVPNEIKSDVSWRSALLARSVIEAELITKLVEVMGGDEIRPLLRNHSGEAAMRLLASSFAKWGVDLYNKANKVEEEFGNILETLTDQVKQ